MDEEKRYENFLIELRELCLYHGFTIEGTITQYEDLVDVNYKMDMNNKTITPTMIAFVGLPSDCK